jgi:hypothetical protein
MLPNFKLSFWEPQGPLSHALQNSFLCSAALLSFPDRGNIYLFNPSMHYLRSRVFAWQISCPFSNNPWLNSTPFRPFLSARTVPHSQHHIITTTTTTTIIVVVVIMLHMRHNISNTQPAKLVIPDWQLLRAGFFLYLFQFAVSNNMCISLVHNIPISWPGAHLPARTAITFPLPPYASNLILYWGPPRISWASNQSEESLRLSVGIEFLLPTHHDASSFLYDPQSVDYCHLLMIFLGSIANI